MHTAGWRCGVFGVGPSIRQTVSAREQRLRAFHPAAPAAAYSVHERVTAWSGVKLPGAARRLGTAHAGERHAGRPPGRTAPDAARSIAP
eukprot:scaffold139447_cov380-Phaeocystis_antarctica.AAC.1